MPFWEGPFRTWVQVKLSSCPEELLSGLSDPQQPTTIAVEQEDGSERNEFSRYWPPASAESATSHKLSAASLVNSYAGLFTGRMRALVQDQLGRGGGVNWDFRYNRTHGIYTASDDSIWAIQISAAGVFAAHLSLCPFEAADTVDGISTKARSFPSSSAIELAGPITMGPAYTSRSALWPESGWAFSASGAKACNVVIGQPGSYLKAYLHEITISETTHVIDGESVQGPGSASVALLEEDYFWGDRLTHVRVPRYPTPSAPPSLVSIDWWRGQVTAPADSATTPIHAHYDGETMVVSRHVRSVNGSYTHTDGSTGSSVQNGFTTPAIPSVPAGFTTSGAFTEIVEIPDPTTYYALNNSASARALRVLSGAVLEYTRVGTWSERSDLHMDVLTIPFGDRESVYHARRLRSISDGTATSGTAEYAWTTVHYKESNAANSRIFEPLGSCSDNAVQDHPDPIVGGSVTGNIVWDAAQPMPDPAPTGYNGTSTRFGSSVQENPATYWMAIGGDCDDMVGGGSPSSTAEAGFNKCVSLGTIDDVVFEFHDVVDTSNTAQAQPGNERWAERWTGRMRRISNGDILTMPSGSNLVRVLPLLYISGAPGSADKRANYTHGTQSINENTESHDTRAALSQQTIAIGTDQALWEEMTIYDPAANVVQRLVVVARDASSAARQLYSEKVFPTMGTPIGPTLAGTAAYPLASLTATMPSWIGKP